ncbi:MAG: Mrp/NBP35 family ATP-binding protein [Bacteroidales bacterium]
MSERKMMLPKNVMDTLRGVSMIGGEKNIVELEMVQELRIVGKKINFSLVFQRSNEPNQKELVEACKQKLTEEYGEVELIVTPKYLHNMSRPILPNVKNIIAVASGKGGVGKSTVSANLAVALANTGAKVGLIDADIYGPSIPKMFGVENEKPESEEIDGKNYIVPVERYGVKMLSIGFFVEPQSALVWRGPMASNALKQLIVDGNWGELDYILIDLPPGTSDIHLTLMQTVPVTGAVIVSTPQSVALIDVVKGINMFRSEGVNVPVLGLVENMSWFTPAELPDNKYYIFGKDGAKDLAEKMDIELLGQLPLVMGIREGGDEGAPVASNEELASHRYFADLANNFIKAVDDRNKLYERTEKIHVKRK